MGTLYVSTFGSDPGSTNLLMWAPLGLTFVVAIVLAVVFRRSSESRYVRYQGLVWALLNPLLLLCLSMAVPEMFAQQFGVVTCLIMLITGVGVNRVASWTGSPALALVVTLLAQAGTLLLLTLTVKGCPGVQADTAPPLDTGEAPSPVLPGVPLPYPPVPVQVVQQPVMVPTVPLSAALPAVQQPGAVLQPMYVQQQAPPLQPAPVYVQQPPPVYVQQPAPSYPGQ